MFAGSIPTVVRNSVGSALLYGGTTLIKETLAWLYQAFLAWWGFQELLAYLDEGPVAK